MADAPTMSREAMAEAFARKKRMSRAPRCPLSMTWLRNEGENAGLELEDAELMCAKFARSPKAWESIIHETRLFIARSRIPTKRHAARLKLKKKKDLATVPEQCESSSTLPLAVASKVPSCPEAVDPQRWPIGCLARNFSCELLIPEIANEVVQYLGIVGFHGLAGSCLSLQYQTKGIALLHFTDFDYEDGIFGMQQSSRMRQRRLPDGEQSRRLVSFLTSSRVWPCLEHVDLSMAPVSALLDPSVQRAFFQMPRLKVLTLPTTGWSTPREKTNVIRQLPGNLLKISRSLEKRVAPSNAEAQLAETSNGGAQGANASQMLASLALPADLPPEHPAHLAVSCGSARTNQFYHFRYNGLHYQTTVHRTHGSHANAARIARLMYARAMSGELKANVLGYREQLYGGCDLE